MPAMSDVERVLTRVELLLPVHDVKMEIVGSCLHHPLTLVSETSKVCVQNGRPYLAGTRAPSLVVHLCDLAYTSAKTGIEKQGLIE